MVIHKSAKVFTLEIIRLYGNTSATFVRVVLWFIVATCERTLHALGYQLLGYFSGKL